MSKIWRCYLGQAVNTFLANHIETVSKVGIRVSKRTRNRRITDALIMMIVFATAAACFSFYWRTQAELALAKAKNQAFVDKVEALKVEADKLEREVHLLKSDPKAIEDFARHQMGFVRTGDVVVKIEKDPTEQAYLSNTRSAITLTQQ
jgi:cell division protein FtsB